MVLSNHLKILANHFMRYSCGLVFMLAGSNIGSFRLELTELAARPIFFAFNRHCLRLLVKNYASMCATTKYRSQLNLKKREHNKRVESLASAN